MTFVILLIVFINLYGIGSKDKSMKLWNLVDGRMVRAVNQIGDNPCGLELCCDETYAVTNTKGEHIYRDIHV